MRDSYRLRQSNSTVCMSRVRLAVDGCGSPLLGFSAAAASSRLWKCCGDTARALREMGRREHGSIPNQISAAHSRKPAAAEPDDEDKIQEELGQCDIAPNAAMKDRRWRKSGRVLNGGDGPCSAVWSSAAATPPARGPSDTTSCIGERGHSTEIKLARTLEGEEG
jgi:hypothetical protein